MDQLVRRLGPKDRALDLGAGPGSFDYGSTEAQIFAIDLAFPTRCQPSKIRIRADSGRLPLRSASFDVVVCNHTLEHFEKLEEALSELGRVLKLDGYLWVAVPDGFRFDDRLYRFLFKGGGHVNRFSLESLLEVVESASGTRPRRYKKLYSGFVYLNPPDPERLPFYPRRARILGRVPPRLLTATLACFNYCVRLPDRVFKTGLSQYGWAVVFQKGPHSTSELDRMDADFNVCYSCGAGHPLPTLEPILFRFLLLWKSYRCPSCGRLNLFGGTRNV